uniref:LanC lantibiotic synthetase component C-like 2 (bacterial) n=1 Tax=Oncorhynchus tshawytscha TaxID=74940 RepID=A0AAZ3RT66_ONCTS
MVKKVQQSLFNLRRLKKFGLSPKALTNFYRCTIESILSGCITTWYGNCSALNRKALQMVVRSAQRITRGKLLALQDTYTTRCHRKAIKIIKDNNHQSHCLFTPLSSRRRGIALLYLQLHRVTCEASHLQRALDYVKRTLRILNGRKVTFLCGDAGPLAVAAVVHHRLKNQTESQECLTKLLQLQRGVVSTDSEMPDELLYGRAGYLYALLYVNKEIGPDTVDETTIARVVTAILESGKNMAKEEKKAEKCPLLYEWHKKQYVGAAHGLAGIYCMLMQPSAKVNQEVLSELVRPSVDYVRHKKFRSGNYPSSLSNETDRLVHWCHGAPGVVHMLIMAHKVFKDEKYLKDAVECGEVIWQRGLLRKGYGICHGTAGNAYSFLTLYQLTQEKKYLYRACKFAEWCLDYGTHGCRIPDRPYSLFEGMAGAIHYLSDLTQPESSCFPAFEL